MTIVCATNGDLPGVRPCTEAGAHRDTCRDHSASDGMGSCPGCLPLAAEVGFLCSHCMSLVEAAYSRWGEFRAYLAAADGKAFTPERGGRGSNALGYSHLSLAFLERDEAERFLASRESTLRMWVNTQAGAADAIQFAHVAQRAYMSQKFIERETRTPPPARCPECGLLTATRNRERVVGAFTVIECQHCGHRIDKVRTGPDAWTGSEACESSNGADHAACPDVDCTCYCHHYGAKSRRAGIELLWDADHHTAAPGAAPRGDWTVTDSHTITRREAGHERKTA